MKTEIQMTFSIFERRMIDEAVAIHNTRWTKRYRLHTEHYEHASAVCSGKPGSGQAAPVLWLEAEDVGPFEIEHLVDTFHQWAKHAGQFVVNCQATFENFRRGLYPT